MPATGQPADLALRVVNTSSIVDGYTLEIPGAPDWLTVDWRQVQLLPGAEETIPVRLAARAAGLVPAQQIPLDLRVRSSTEPSAHIDVPILVTVPALDVPIRLQAEPSLLRLRDQDSASGTLLVDNGHSNRRVQVRLLGTDPELAVTFGFEPPEVQVEPGATQTVRVTFRAALPEPGQEVFRRLTVAAQEGERRVETPVTLHQSATPRTEQPLVGLEAEPGLIRARDSTVALARVMADNRGGTEWAHLQLRASDPERVVRVAWASPELHVPPGGTAQTELRLASPLPDPGSETSRTVTISGSDGKRTSSTTLTLVQTASASPMATLAVRLDPSVVRVHDADGARVQLVLDNRRGRSAVRLGLTGHDPERAIGFDFAPPQVAVGPGQVATVSVGLRSPRPESGQERTRPFTVSAGDGVHAVDASGSLVQTSSRAAIELLAVHLDPSVVRMPNRRRGALSAVVDNRQGAQGIRVSLRGDDPENAVGFRFVPSVLDVAPGAVARSQVRIEARRPAGGQELRRPFTISASDGRSGATAEGSLIQSSSERRPLIRVLLTLLGGLAMIVGAMLPVRSGSRLPLLQVNAALFERIFGQDFNLVDAANLVSVGLIVIVLAGLMMFGLTGRSGRLTRLCAVLGVLLVVATLVAIGASGRGVTPGSGSLLVLLGCVSGYIGGLLARR